MDPLIKYNFFFLLFILIINPVLAIQPSLPTYFYGKVMNSDSSPAEDITVTATFIDNNNMVRTTTTKTLTSDENKDLVGYYFFNDGYVQAKEGTQISVEVSGVVINIMANPGRPAMDIGKIFLGAKTSEFQSHDQKTGETASQDSTSSGLPPTTTTTPTSEQPTAPLQGTTTTEAPVQPESAQRPPIDTPTDSNFQGTTPQIKSDSSNQLPKHSITMYGQLLDEDGEPIGEEEITLEWVDENGIKHKTTTSTLSKKEAKKLGDKSLEGYYIFNEGDMVVKSDSSVEIIVGDGYHHISIKPEEGQKVRINIQSEDDSKIIGKKPRFEITTEKVMSNLTTLIASILIAIIFFIIVYKSICGMKRPSPKKEAMSKLKELEKKLDKLPEEKRKEKLSDRFNLFLLY